MLHRINDYRAQAGIGQLTLSRTLMSTAAWKSNDLGINGYFDHNDLFRSWSQRFQDCGYMAQPTEENLAAGYADAASTFEQWRTTSGHNAVMLSGSMKAVGIARASVPGSPFGWYWTASFGGIVDGAQSATSTAASVLPSAGGSPLAVGSTAKVTGAGTNDCLRVHSTPATTAPVVACLADGASMLVTDGPITADGYTWWRLGALGWSASAYLAAALP